MARKKNPEQLRAEAQKLIEEAEKIENQQCERAGRLMLAHHKNGFKKFDLQTFKAELTKIFGPAGK